MKHFRRRMLANGLAMALVVSSLAVIPAAAANNVDFKDIKGHWAESQIKNFLEKGHINGYGDNTFRPDNKITRAEFIKIVNMAFGFTEKGKEDFKDVKPGDWFYDEVLKAVKQGYIDGYGDNTFRPDAAISREEACKIIGVIVKANGVGDTKFKDDKEIESWARKYVKGLVDMGIIRGFGDDTFRPKSNTSRAESVTAIKDSVEYTPSTGGGGGSSQDRVAPKLVTSELKGNKIELVFDESLAGTVNKEEFAVKDGNREIKINAILKEKNKITIELEKAFGSGALGANIKVSYKGTSLSDAAGNKVVEFEKEASNVSMHLNIDGSSRVGKGTESIYNAKHDDNTDATNVSWYVEGSNKDNSIEGVSISADGKLVVEKDSPVESIEVVAISETNGKTYVAKKFVTITDNEAPILLVSELKGNKIELVFDEALAGEVNKNEFIVKDGNKEIEIKSVVKEGKKVTVELAKAFGAGALGSNVKVSYSGTSLFDVAGNEVESFEKEAYNVVSNLNIVGSSSVEKGAEFIYNAKHDDNTDASNVSWYVEGSNKDNSIEGVRIESDGKLVVEKGSPVESIEVVAISETNGKTYVAKKFVTITDNRAPIVATSQLKGNKIELVFDEALAGEVNKNEFTVKDGNKEVEINSLVRDENKITLELGKVFGSGALGSNVKVSYTGTVLSDLKGNKVATFEKDASNVAMHLNIDGSSRVGKGTESIYNAKHDDNTDATNVSWYVEGSNKDNSTEGVNITADGKLVVEESSPVESIEVVAVSESNGKTYVAKKFVTLFQRTELEIATDTVTKAETTRDYNDYMEAQRLINKLPNSLEKTALQERLANVVTVKVEKLGEKEYMTLQFPKQISKFTIMSGDKSLVFGLNEEEFKLEIEGATTSNPDSNGFRKYTIGETEITAKVEYSRVIFEVVDGNTDITNIEFEVK